MDGRWGIEHRVGTEEEKESVTKVPGDIKTWNEPSLEKKKK